MDVLPWQIWAAITAPVVILGLIGLAFWLSDRLKQQRAAERRRMEIADLVIGEPWRRPLQKYSREQHTPRLLDYSEPFSAPFPRPRHLRTPAPPPR